MSAVEANFDGLVGPTHNYAGLSSGNIASQKHRGLESNPRQAALQGLEKMKYLADLGLVQGVIPPQERPSIEALKRLGFHGSDKRILADAMRDAPMLLANCSSASSMWSANAATVSPSADTADARVHFTPANLISKLHRSLETDTTARLLRAIFPDEHYFHHHAALPAHESLGDEGAANHTRFCLEYDEAGIELFVFGRTAFSSTPAVAPGRYPARQTREASEAIARQHGLRTDSTVFLQQNPAVIDQGVFHNDVIAVGNRSLLLCHEHAFVDPTPVYNLLKQRFGSAFTLVEVSDAELSVADAVSSYLFNSQLLSLPSGGQLLLLPSECRDNPRVWSYVQRLKGADIKQVEVFNLNQSMNNGGGPACLRLRVVLSDAELGAVNPRVLMNEELYAQLRDWVEAYYPDRLLPADLADPLLLQRSREALERLTQLLGLGAVYPFQIAPGHQP